jgi:polar amino acid transport system substrate-binding protein
MKKIMKKVVVTLCLTMTAAFMLVGCGDKDSDTLTVATNAEFPPYESMEDGEYVGFDIELLQMIAEKMEKEVVFQNMDFDGVVGAVQSGTCDIAISGLTITPKRAESVAFSTPYINAAQYLIVNADDEIFTGTTKEILDAQLIGKKIGVCTGFTGEKYVSGDDDMGYEAIEDAEAAIFDNISLAVTALKNGSIDAIIMDDIPSIKVAESEENKDDIKAIEISLTVEE